MPNETPPSMTYPLSDALTDALVKWLHPNYDAQEDAA